uniref:accessory gene regulator B family protein n=1 Tax=Faecousia sp. TaxID=2952921 RepID=UPI004025D3FC
MAKDRRIGDDRIYKAATWICDRLCENQIIPAEREKAYIYGFELLISSFVGIFCLILLSALCGIKYAWIPYLIGFIPLRVTGGGYHAKTHFMCIISFSAVFLFLLYSSRMLALIRNAHLILMVASLVVMYFFTPIEAQNKPLSKQTRHENRKRCIAVSWCAVGVSVILVLMKVNASIYVMMYFMGVFAANISILAVVLTRK